MKLFLDTADTKEIAQVADLGLLDGVTTNPSIIASSKRKFKEVIKEICDITKGPVSAEVISVNYDGMLAEAMDLANIAENVVIKIPLIPEGIKCVAELTKRKIKTNVTLCFSAPQALLAAKVGATYISPFIGRLDDISFNGIDLVSEIRRIYDNYNFETQILAASIRHPIHFKEVAIEGADAVTLPYSIFQMLFKHPQTDLGLIKFLEDAKKIVY
ncbi:MAG: fructose-6-phosphate aldolase [Leptospiraceae bacterium]|nr:fructose-6-phosphate aldolase [Leptospiraceae bacterium]